MFDLNGTLVTENYLSHDEVFEDVLKYRRRGRALTPKDMGEVAKGQRPLSAVVEEVYEIDNSEMVSRKFIKTQASRVAFREGAVDILEVLNEKYILILCSDTTGIAKEVVKRLKLLKFFSRIFYSCDVGFLKSEEEFWIEIMKHFPNSEPQNFLVVGDNARSDMYNPNRLKMHTVLIANPIKMAFDYRETSSEYDDEKPQYSIRELKELLPMLGLG